MEAAGFAAVALVGGGIATKALARQRLATGVGERRERRLADGSMLMLNTDSEVLWRPGDRGVELWPRRGEFSLAAGAGSLVLHAQDAAARLTPNGRYNVRVRGPLLDVAVLRGQASAMTGGAGAATHAMAAQTLLLTGGAALTRLTPEPELQAIEAWPRGEVAFENEPLSSAVEQYNRYLTRKLVIADPELGAVRVGGRFTSADPADFLRALSASLDIAARPAGDALILTRANPAK